MLGVFVVGEVEPTVVSLWPETASILELLPRPWGRDLGGVLPVCTGSEVPGSAVSVDGGVVLG